MVLLMKKLQKKVKTIAKKLPVFNLIKRHKARKTHIKFFLLNAEYVNNGFKEKTKNKIPKSAF